jgi:hypothetical protein
VVKGGLHVSALERVMLPEEAELDVVSANWTLARLGASSWTHGNGDLV